MARKATTSRDRSTGRPAPTVMLVRQFHTYLSAFVAPSILFLAATGALQLFSLHESHGGYHPPALIEKLGSLHKDQRFALKPTRPDSARRTPVVRSEGDWIAPSPEAAADSSGRAAFQVQALKWVFLAAAVTLIVSTLLGLWMGMTQSRRKVVVFVLFVLGAAAPVAILLL